VPPGAEVVGMSIRWPRRDSSQPPPGVVTRPSGDLDHWPRIRPLSFLEAFTYALAYLLVTSARDVIDNPFLMPTTLTDSRAFLREARTAFRGQFS
jgi:hypothetical protein